MENYECKNRENILEQFRLTTPIFQALGDINRQQIIMVLLKSDSLNVNQITENMSISRPAVSHHLKILKQAGLIIPNKNGKETYYSLSTNEFLKHIKELVSAIEAGY
ncbi:transcriptional regulator [Bacillus pseudomycoides]|uniref:Transcriptional regulator n=1 Tax=Bacillus pseudomycoides TaxID=64104 RepID=A0AA91ZUX6_9BACI|nr:MULTISPECIES: metalloregulator ArsR/SmtB family transcription factor [Bacillus]PEB52238.1 transcriptional regulator [Bacillus sp. AFS098217]PED84084.1 transcriptional regulator [Bacillus pseudomycoides]PEU11656.1 transcriptional regulator [Bacillus sp. AFS019443]PEU12840.1 transcriptional regulator [Bacillus sp. AFS014408]PFW64735.1 transcriptional regulator [Bacillus sp. AFS075034]